MSTPLFAGNFLVNSFGGGDSPDPVTTADTSWTWDVEFDPVADSLYARASLNTFTSDSGGWCGGGIVEYRTRNPDGSDSVHSIGQPSPDGYADFAWDNNVDSVTFGWIVGGNGYTMGRLNLEIWT